MQPSGTVGTNMVEEHLGIIPVKFGQNPMSDQRRSCLKKLMNAVLENVEVCAKFTSKLANGS